MSDFDFLLQIRAFHRCFTVQKEIVSDFWRRADDVLSGSNISLKKLPPRFLTLRHNYFSVLFLTVYDILGIPPERMRLYAMINHCMRTWVTACDNLLDNELKEMIITDLPEGSRVFKSVHTLLVADRIFFSVLTDAFERGDITLDEMRLLSKDSLATLSASGVEEAGEEGGVDYSLTPDEILRDIHEAKTGKLFTAPLSAPILLGDIDLGDPNAEHVYEGLRLFGLACQVLDDLTDLGIDVWEKKHNYMAAVIVHGDDTEERLRFESFAAQTDTAPDNGVALYEQFPKAAKSTLDTCLDLYDVALEHLSDAGLPLGIARRQSFISVVLKLYGVPVKLSAIRGA